MSEPRSVVTDLVDDIGNSVDKTDRHRDKLWQEGDDFEALTIMGSNDNAGGRQGDSDCNDVAGVRVAMLMGVNDDAGGARSVSAGRQQMVTGFAGWRCK